MQCYGLLHKQLYKRGNPNDRQLALPEWCRRFPDFPGDDAVKRKWDETKRSRHGKPLKALHAIRMKNPVLSFYESNMDPVDVDEDGDEAPVNDDGGVDVAKLLTGIRTSQCAWETCVRVVKKLCPDDESKKRVVTFVKRAYRVNEARVTALWELGGEVVSLVLNEYVRMSMTRFRLITEVIPKIYDGAPVRTYKWDEAMEWLDFELDCVPKVEVSFNLVNGTFVAEGGETCIKLGSKLFDHATADVTLAELLLTSSGITKVLCCDDADDKYRTYMPANGVWELIDDSAAVVIVSGYAKKLLEPMHHLQFFRERIHPKYNRKHPVVFPKSNEVKAMISNYTEVSRRTKDVLNNMKQRIRVSFDATRHSTLLCFSNGIVNLRTGVLEGPAPPEYFISRFVRREYKPDVDTTQLDACMQSFFPEQCYDGDHTNVLRFYQKWRGYCVSGDTLMQASLWITGRGSNGKSVLSSFDKHVWGNELCSTVSMSALQQQGSGNNDFIYNSRNARSIAIVENSDNRVMCEVSHRDAIV